MTIQALRRMTRSVLHLHRPRPRARLPRSRPSLSSLVLWAGACCIAGWSSDGEGAPATFDLRVVVTDVDNAKGVVAVGLFDSEKAFPKQERARSGALAKITGHGATVTFHGLAPGVYAIAVLHDENQNAKMDFNFVGMPLEGFGFSNDAPVSFGPPSFKAAAFRLEPRNSKIAIKMRYFLR